MKTHDVRIVLADDHKIFRAGLKSLIDKEPGFRVVGQADNGENLLAILRATPCDLVVLDLSMPKLDGIAALKILRGAFSKIKVLVLTMIRDKEHLKHAMDAGARGYVLKEEAFEQLLRAIKTVSKDKNYISQSAATLDEPGNERFAQPGEDPCPEILTSREREILAGIVKGLANKNIAAQLKISVRTVETHRGHLTRKLGLKSTASLVKYAISKKII